MFAYLAGLVVENDYADDTDQVYKSLLSREEEGTTGMMDGFAIPHAKSQAVIKPGIAVLKLKMELSGSLWTVNSLILL